VAGWLDLTQAFNTVREIDTTAIRAEAERDVVVTCVGAADVIDDITARLIEGSGRYPAVGLAPLTVMSLDEFGQRSAVGHIVMLAVGPDWQLRDTERHGLAQLAAMSAPKLIVVWGMTVPAEFQRAGELRSARLVVVPDPTAAQVTETLAAALLDLLPADLQLAAARRLPGLRTVFARRLVASVSFTNASYALASALPEQIPLFGVPFAVADMLVLTKNQILLVYRLGLGLGAPPELRERLRELVPVFGGAYLWRQLARSFIGLIPVWGIAPKVAIAYAGTYVTGVSAWRWFADGELLSQARIRQISREALAIGRARAADMLAAARQQGSRRAGRLQEWWRALWRRVRRKQ
jgi:uncharacterized protein (DUF697 family)